MLQVIDKSVVEVKVTLQKSQYRFLDQLKAQIETELTRIKVIGYVLNSLKIRIVSGDYVLTKEEEGRIVALANDFSPDTSVAYPTKTEISNASTVDDLKAILLRMVSR